MTAGPSKAAFHAAASGDSPLGRPFGFNVIGHISANVGVGVVAREAIRLMLQKGYPVATFDIDPGRGRSGHETAYAKLAAPSIDDLPYGISLIILSITSLPDIILDGRVKLRDDVVNAGYFWWELPVIPEIWVKSLEQFDVLVAGSQYLRSTFERHVPGTPAVYAQHGLQDLGGIHPDRAKFGLPVDKVIFVCILEPTSDPARKNPFAAIRAFQGAFSSEEPAHLVIKVNNAQAGGGGSDLLAQLRNEVTHLGKRVTLIENILTYGEVLQLYASCDVFVGLHRAEGLGLGLMEAMALGKPVIATGWSGNMTFMNHVNSCLVGYRLIPVNGSLGVYSRAFLKQESRWADPNLDEAEAWMKALARNATLRASIGRNAAEAMRRHCAEAERGVFIDELRTIWEQQQFLPRSTAGKMDRMDASLKTLREARFKHHAGPIEKARRKSIALAERHLLWRFRSK
jgi:glycosyltransferase involved in cell wall biosynthesis